MSDVEERDAVVRDAVRLAREAPAELTARMSALALRDQAEVVLRLPARERLELLLHAPQPMRLVRTLPDSELYFTIRDVGPFDALPLLALASAHQLIHLLDLESWRGDRFDGDRSGAWVTLILESGEPTLIRFLRAADDELLALLFCKWVRVREADEEDESDEGYPSPDGQHRFIPTIEEHARAIQRIAEILWQDDAHRYARILRIAQWELPSQLEETSLQWRTSRLEERGFPDFESALSVYAAPEGLAAGSAGIPPAIEDAISAPRTALRTRDVAAQVVAWLEALPGELFERALFELTAVANKILVADHADTGDPAAHGVAMERAVGFVGIALAARAVTDDAQAQRAFETVPVLELFREGFARATALQVSARRFVRDGWPSRHARAMETLDPLVRRRIAALIGRRPLVHDPAVADAVREFHSLADLDEAARALELAQTLGDLVTGTLGWDLAALLESLTRAAEPATLDALWITSMARYAATQEIGSGPLAASAVLAFRERMQDAAARSALAQSFVAALRLAQDTPLHAHAIACLSGFARDGSPAPLTAPR